MIGIPLAWTASSSLRIAPHQLAYFNESVGGPEQGYLLKRLQSGLGPRFKGIEGVHGQRKSFRLSICPISERHRRRITAFATKMSLVKAPRTAPPEKFRPDAPRKILAISAYNLQDVSKRQSAVSVALDARPIAKIGYSIFVYDLTNDQEGIIKLEEIYVKPRSPNAKLWDQHFDLLLGDNRNCSADKLQTAL